MLIEVWIHVTYNAIEGNPYWDWICQYAADDYQQAVIAGIGKT